MNIARFREFTPVTESMMYAFRPWRLSSHARSSERTTRFFAPRRDSSAPRM